MHAAANAVIIGLLGGRGTAAVAGGWMPLRQLLSRPAFARMLRALQSGVTPRSLPDWLTPRSWPAWLAPQALGGRLAERLGERLGATFPALASRLGRPAPADRHPLHRPLARPVTVVLLGAGQRGSIYADYARLAPQEMRVVAVADPSPLRRQRIAEQHGIPPERCHADWADALAEGPVADAVIIATPDRQHTAPCLRALALGYDVLLEKPIAPTEAECRQILAAAQASGRIVGVCHVLRYAPYFRELKALLEAGAIGELVSVQHLEPIEHTHMSHSYVRGPWRNSQASTPILLAKSCHDTDILRWLVGAPAARVQCFGGLKWFVRAHAPAGSTERCTDGCAAERHCPYSALKIYQRERRRLHVFDLPESPPPSDEAIVQALRRSDYGRCVYRMDNDQPDHLTTNIEFANGVTAAFSMEAFTASEGRCTRLMGALGDIVGDMQGFTWTRFRDGRRMRWRMRTDSHGGGDHRMMRDWVQAVGQRNPALLSSPIEDSVESHLMAFAAERSRQARSVEPVATVPQAGPTLPGASVSPRPLRGARGVAGVPTPAGLRSC